MERGPVGKLLLSVLVLLAGSCISTFTPLESDFRAKGKTLAVIAGLDNEANEVAARYMSEALRKNTRFQVMPQKLVAQTLGD